MRVKNYFSQVILSIVSAFILLPNISQAAPKSVTCIINYDSSLENAKEEWTLVWDDDNRSNIYVNGRRIPSDIDERSEYALEQFGNSIIRWCLKQKDGKIPLKSCTTVDRTTGDIQSVFTNRSGYSQIDGRGTCRPTTVTNKF